jgi:hypothetical protein
MVDSDDEDDELDDNEEAPSIKIGTYQLIDGVEINTRQGPSHTSAATGSKVESGSIFEVLEVRVVVGGRPDGGGQTFLRLAAPFSGGWAFLYHPSKGHALAQWIAPPASPAPPAPPAIARSKGKSTRAGEVQSASSVPPTSTPQYQFRFRRRFELTECVVCNAPPSAPSPECSFLVCNPAKSVVFEATSSAERDQWLESIRSAIAAAASPPPTAATSASPATASSIREPLNMAPVWQSALGQESKKKCQLCNASVGVGTRHHCRKCGALVCGGCSYQKMQLNNGVVGEHGLARVCNTCATELKRTRPYGVQPQQEEQGQNEHPEERQQVTLQGPPPSQQPAAPVPPPVPPKPAHMR